MLHFRSLKYDNIIESMKGVKLVPIFYQLGMEILNFGQYVIYNLYVCIS